MNSYQRVLKAMRHEPTGRVPLFYRDVPEVEQRLLADLHLPDRDALLTALGIDFRWVQPKYVGPSLEDEQTGNRKDIWGVEYKYVHFSDSGGYWEAVSHPLQHCTEIAELEDYPWPTLDLFDFSTLPNQVARYAGYAIMTAPGYASPGILSPLQWLLGMERSWTVMLLESVFYEALIEKMMAFLEPFTQKMLQSAIGGIHFFRIGDDFGTQRGLIFRPELWRRAFAPYLKRLADIAHDYGAFYYHHSCGGIRELIPELIAIGVDVLDPVQVKASGMDPKELKQEFGDKIVFSGGIDEQELLPNGTPQQIQLEVHRLLDTMASSGGYFIGPTHNFQDDIPTENIVAMYKAARDWTPPHQLRT
jgi:uroporphyrinogen decarboxylase